MEDLPPLQISELKQQILTDDIQSYNDIAELNMIVSTLKSNSDTAVSEFKEVLIMLTEELARVTGDHMLMMHKTNIVGFINKNPKGLVDSLILKCYEAKDGMLRERIVKGDDSFFMSNSLDDVSEGDSSIVNIIFQFKNFWGKLNTDNRNIIKNSLLALISLCDMRYLAFKKYQCLKKLNQTYTHIFSELDNIF